MKTTAALVAGMLALWAGPTMAHEPPGGLLVHLPLDDDLEDAGGFAVPVDLVAPDGELLDSGAEFRDGRFGRALYVSGESALRVSLDLHPEFNPQVTISLWAYLEADGPGSGYVASNGTNDGHVLRLGSNGRPGIGFNGAQKSSDQSFGIGRWILMAGTWDYQAGRAELYTGRRSATWGFEPQAGINPQPDLWLGAWKTPSPHIAKGIRIDEVRVYDRVLTAEEIEGLWLGQPVADSAAGRAPGGGTQTLRPGLCDIFTVEQATQLLGAQARMAEIPNNGEPGAPCNYVAPGQIKLGFSLIPLSHDVYNPDSDPMEVWVEWLSGQSSNPVQIWEQAPGDGGYFSHSGYDTGANVITPFRRTAMMSDRIIGRWLLRVTLRGPDSETDRLQKIRTVAERVVETLGAQL